MRNELKGTISLRDIDFCIGPDGSPHFSAVPKVENPNSELQDLIHLYEFCFSSMYYQKYEDLSNYLAAQNQHWYLQVISIVVSVLSSNLGSYLAVPQTYVQNFLAEAGEKSGISTWSITKHVIGTFLDEFKDELIVENIISRTAQILGVNPQLAEQLGELISFAGEKGRTAFKVVQGGNFQSLADTLREDYKSTVSSQSSSSSLVNRFCGAVSSIFKSKRIVHFFTSVKFIRSVIAEHTISSITEHYINNKIMLQDLLLFTTTHMQNQIEDWLQKTHPGESIEFIIRDFANPESMRKSRQYDVIAALYMFKDLSLESFANNKILNELWGVSESKERFLIKETDSGEKFKSNRDGFEYEFIDRNWHKSRSTESVSVTEWLKDARKIEIFDPISYQALIKVISNQIGTFEEFSDQVLKDSPFAEYWKQSGNVKSFFTFLFRTLNMIGHSEGFYYKKRGINKDTLIEVHVDDSIGMTLQEVLKNVKSEYADGVKGKKIPFKYITDPNVYKLFLPVEIDGESHQLLSFPKSAGVKILINSEEESVDDAEKTKDNQDTKENFRKMMYESSLIVSSIGKIKVTSFNNLKDIKQIKGGYSGLRTVRDNLINFNFWTPGLAKNIINMYIDFEAINRDVPNLGTVLKENFFENVKSWSKIYIFDDEGNKIGKLDKLVEDYFKKDAESEFNYWKHITTPSNKNKKLSWNKEVISQIKVYIENIIEIQNKIGGYSRGCEITMQSKKFLKYFNNYIQNNLGILNHFIEDTRIDTILYEDSAIPYIYEWELSHMIWLSLASLYPNLDEFHAEIDFLIDHKQSISETQINIKNKYKNYKIGDSYYYQLVNMLPDPEIIIGAKKITNIVSFIQFGMSLISVLDSGLEKLVVQSLLAVLTADNTFDFNKIGTEGFYSSPYSLILPQFLMKLWNPATSEYFKTEKTEQIEGYLMDFLVMENLAWLHNSPDQTSTWRFPGIYGIGVHGVDIKNEKYWKDKPRKVWTAFMNGLSIINIFRDKNQKDEFDKKLRKFKLDKNNENEPLAIPEMLVRIVIDDARSFFLLRNQPEMKGLSIKESITKMAKWLRAEKLAGHEGTKFLGIGYKIPSYK
ncbi:hypothetical protein, partial [Candidatus Harpocratesius sp.]